VEIERSHRRGLVILHCLHHEATDLRREVSDLTASKQSRRARELARLDQPERDERQRHRHATEKNDTPQPVRDMPPDRSSIQPTSGPTNPPA